jgi:hypothetical protein
MPPGTLQTRARALGLLAASLVLPSASAAAQTRFAWPDTTVKVEAYTTLEECQAVVDRSLDYTASRKDLATGAWADTLPLDSLDASGMKALPAAVVETARRCGTRFSDADSVSLESFGVLFPLYLQAGWDDRARTLVERRLAAVGAKDDVERAAVLDSVFDVLLGRKGHRIGARRIAMVEELADTQLPRVADRVKRLRIYANLALVPASGSTSDSATAKVLRIAQKMAVIVDSLTPSEMDELLSGYGTLAEGIDEAGDFVQRYYAMLNMSLGKRTFLDSLRHSTAAYVKLKRDNWAQATGMRPETYQLGNPLGEHAEPIEAEIWLGYDPKKGPRPTPGRISLVVFLSNHECNGVVTQAEQIGGDCADHLAPLKRLEQRFPELDITVVGQTYGHFLYLKDGITPEREAELTKKWLEWHGVDAPLAMNTAAHWRLPDPDSRRVSRPTANRSNYSFGKSWKAVNTSAYLIDQNGIVVHARQMNRWSVYEDFGELIQILLERQRKGAGVTP